MLDAHAIPGATQPPWRKALDSAWAPMPLMLESTVVLALALRKCDEVSVITGLA